MPAGLLGFPGQSPGRLSARQHAIAASPPFSSGSIHTAWAPESMQSAGTHHIQQVVGAAGAGVRAAGLAHVRDLNRVGRGRSSLGEAADAAEVWQQPVNRKMQVAEYTSVKLAALQVAQASRQRDCGVHCSQELSNRAAVTLTSCHLPSRGSSRSADCGRSGPECCWVT